MSRSKHHGCGRAKCMIPQTTLTVADFCTTCNGWGLPGGCEACGWHPRATLARTDRFALVPLDSMTPSSPVAAVSRRPSSDAWLTMIYRGKAARNLALRALTWPWRGGKNSWRMAVVVIGGAVLASVGMVTFDLPTTLAGLAILGPYVARAYLTICEKIGHKIDSAMAEEIDRLAREDGNG